MKEAHRLPVGTLPMIRVLIISSSTAVQQGLTALCETAPDMQVIETAVNAQSPAAPLPHIILVDGQEIEMSLQQVQQLKQLHPLSQIILLVENLNSEIIWSAARAGAAGCIRKEDSAPGLLQTVRTIYKQSGSKPTTKKPIHKRG